MSAESQQHTSPFGELLRYWRGVRGTSQLDLAYAARTTPRHVSFIETGRAQPSREMVLRLAAALDVPLRDRNGLLLAAGYAPLYPETPLDGPELELLEAALDLLLDRHEPYPAVVMDRHWDVVRVNAGAEALFGVMVPPQQLPSPPNVLRLMLEPGPVQQRVANWPAVVPTLISRARHEAVGGVLDQETAALVDELAALPAVARVLGRVTVAPTLPVVDVHFDLGAMEARFFSMVTTIGTPMDVTAQELRVEAFFPSDRSTAAWWPRWATGRSRPAAAGSQ